MKKNNLFSQWVAMIFQQGRVPLSLSLPPRLPLPGYLCRTLFSCLPTERWDLPGFCPLPPLVHSSHARGVANLLLTTLDEPSLSRVPEHQT